MLCLKSQIRVGCGGRGTSVGDAALAGVSMDAAAVSVGAGDCPARQGRDRRLQEEATLS